MPQSLDTKIQINVLNIIKISSQRHFTVTSLEKYQKKEHMHFLISVEKVTQGLKSFQLIKTT